MIFFTVSSLLLYVYTALFIKTLNTEILNRDRERKGGKKQGRRIGKEKDVHYNKLRAKKYPMNIFIMIITKNVSHMKEGPLTHKINK